MKFVSFRAALGVAALAAVAGASPASAQQTVTFLCNAPAGHVCQFQINTAAGPINFALPSGQRTECPTSSRTPTSTASAIRAR